MKKRILALYDYLSSHKRMTVLLLLVVLALCSVSTLRMKYDEDISAFLPQGPESQRYAEVYR